MGRKSTLRLMLIPTNDESCDDILGRVCGGEGADLSEDGEEFIHIHAGIHGIGSLDESEYDWRNPVATVSIRRIGGADD